MRSSRSASRLLIVWIWVLQLSSTLVIALASAPVCTKPTCSSSTSCW